MTPRPISRNDVLYHQSRLQRVALVSAQYISPARQYKCIFAVTVLVSLRTSAEAEKAEKEPITCGARSTGLDKIESS